MRFSTVFAVVAAVLPVFVQGKNITVKVGDGGLVFNPNNIQAAVDDIVNFEFQGKNHSVTQSTFASPCAPMMADGKMGINSGFMPLGATPPAIKPVWSIKIVNASTPLWFFCAQAGHCQMGMVAAINAPTSGAKTFDAYKALAMSVPSGSAPPPSTPSGLSPPVGGSAAPANPAPAPSSSPESSNSQASTNGALSRLTLGTGSVAATAFGLGVALLL